MKKRGKNNHVVIEGLVLFSILFFTISFVFAAHIITTSSGGTSFDPIVEGTIFTFNITVNNTDSLETAKITQVNVTIPGNFTFSADSNGTDAGTHTFSNTSTVLSWSNDELVMNLTWNYFWFDANVTFYGEYNITIATVNSTGTQTTNISINVTERNDPPIVVLNSPENTGEVTNTTPT